MRWSLDSPISLTTVILTAVLRVGSVWMLEFFYRKNFLWKMTKVRWRKRKHKKATVFDGCGWYDNVWENDAYVSCNARSYYKCKKGFWKIIYWDLHLCMTTKTIRGKGKWFYVSYSFHFQSIKGHHVLFHLKRSIILVSTISVLFLERTFYIQIACTLVT